MASLSREETASKYSKALFDYAKDANQLELIHDEMIVLKQVLDENPETLVLLSDPILSKDQKEKFLASFTVKLSDESTNFLNFLLEYNRFNNLYDIIIDFTNIYNSEKNIADGTAITTYKLDSADLKKISSTYSRKFNLNKLRLTNIVDESVLGGVILHVGDKVIDGSVKRRLKNLREQIIDNK